MQVMDPQQRIQELSQELSRHQYQYYIKAEPLVSDAQYDALFDELLSLERRYPEYRLPDSPSQRVGSDLDQSFPQKKHLIPVLSLDKANSPGQVSTWIDKTRAQFPDSELVIEDKIDGLSIVLYYQDGLLGSALTRGDGERGNDITDNAKTIRQVPLRIACSEPVIVRGEIYLEKDDFQRLNQDQQSRFSNPRNLAAGSIRLSRSTQVARIPLKFAAHDAHFPNQDSQTHLDNLLQLQDLGFPLIQPIYFIGPDPARSDPLRPNIIRIGFNDIAATLESIRQRRAERPYEIDGLVFKINQHRLREKMGMTSHHPRWAIAFKFDAPCAETRLLSIDIQVGRNGRITPVANLEPVPISGSIVSRATLHNQLTIDTLNLGPGDLVTVSKRGDVIPAVEEVVHKAEGQTAVFALPRQCPVCRQSLQLLGAHHFCVNRQCPERIQKQIIFFAAKGQMDIVGLGEQTIRQLFSLGLIRSLPDLYRLDYSLLAGQPGFGDKKIRNIADSVQNSKRRPFSAVLAALGIEGLGPQSIRQLLDNGIDSIDKIREIADSDQLERLTSIPGIGPAMVQTIRQFFADPENRRIIEDLARLGLSMSESSADKPNLSGPFSGQLWVITGTFTAFQPREKAAELIRSLGGAIGASVSAKTSQLLVGDNPGSKLEKARQMGIPIVTEAEFIAMLAETAPEFTAR